MNLGGKQTKWISFFFNKKFESEGRNATDIAFSILGGLGGGEEDGGSTFSSPPPPLKEITRREQKLGEGAKKNLEKATPGFDAYMNYCIMVNFSLKKKKKIEPIVFSKKTKKKRKRDVIYLSHPNRERKWSNANLIFSYNEAIWKKCFFFFLPQNLSRKSEVSQLIFSYKFMHFTHLLSKDFHHFPPISHQNRIGGVDSNKINIGCFFLKEFFSWKYPKLYNNWPPAHEKTREKIFLEKYFFLLFFHKEALYNNWPPLTKKQGNFFHKRVGTTSGMMLFFCCRVFLVE